MKHSRIILSVAASALSLTLLAPAHAQTEPVIVAGPGSYLFAGTYYTPVSVVAKGGDLTLYNLDIQLHDVVASTAVGPDTPWCAEKKVPLGKCPLFYTDLISLGESAPLQGTENLTPGQRYAFKCSIHPWMQGTLVTLPNT